MNKTLMEKPLIAKTWAATKPSYIQQLGTMISNIGAQVATFSDMSTCWQIQTAVQ